MKKLLLIIFILRFTLFLNAQSEIGMTLNQVKKIYPSSEYKTAEETSTGIIKYCVIGNYDIEIFLFRITTNKCGSICIIPLTEVSFQVYFKDFNKKYTIISTNKWRTSTLNYDIEVELTTIDLGDNVSKRCFMITPL
jgi:hypothetical protein